MIEKRKYLDIRMPFAFAIIALLALSYFSYNRINNLIEEATEVNHTNLVKLSLEKTFIALSEKESSHRGYLFTSDSVFLPLYLAADTIIHSELNTIESLTKDNPAQQQNTIVLRTLIDQRIEMMRHNLALSQTSKFSIPDRLKGKTLMDNVRSQVNKMEAEEDKLLSVRSAAFSKSAFVTPLFTIFLIIGSVTLLLVSYFQISREQNKSNTLASNLETRAAELVVANKELAFQNAEKENRAADLIIANYARSLIEASLDPLVTISADGKILDVNAASIKVTGIPREKLIGTDFSNYFTEPKKAQEGYLQVFEKGFVSNYPLTIKHKDGILTDVLYNASVYKDSKGNVLGVFAAARDVTEQKQASQYARSLIEASLDPLVTISADGKILDVNAASIKVTGIPREKLIDTDFSDYFTEPEKAREGYLQVFEKGFVSNYPLTIKHKNGNLTDVLYNASVYKDDKGNILGVFAAARDITEQKKVENVLKESEEKFKLIFEKSTAPIIVADDKGNYLEVNKAVADVFEYSINELMGMNVGDLITTSNSNAAAQYEEYIKKGEEIGEFGFTSKKGTPKIVQYQAVRLKPDYNLSILMDVTEQRQASQYARSLIEASLDPLVTISAAGKILDVNEASVKVTGVPREKLIDTDFSDYFTEPKKAQEGYLQVFEKGFVSDYPLTIKHKDGILTDVLYNASVYKDSKGNVLGVFAAARDVTEQKWAKDLRVANKELAFQNDEKEKRASELVIANKELESFNYISSHDLQEPLRKIQVFASRLIADESQNLSTKGIHYIFRMQDAANRMQTLIADLLAYSRSISSERKFEITDLNTIIESVKKEFADALDAKNATIEVAEMCDVRVIPFQFRQLLDNIIGNALKFAKPDLPPHIIIKSSIIKGNEVNNPKLLSEKEYCHIAITDNGLGFEPQYKDQIFELFKRLHDKEKIKGTGIGLSIVKKIVDNHNGLITATSELNKGATFDIYIPTN